MNQIVSALIGKSEKRKTKLIFILPNHVYWSERGTWDEGDCFLCCISKADTDRQTTQSSSSFTLKTVNVGRLCCAMFMNYEIHYVVCVCVSDLVLELSDLVPELVDVLPRVRMVQLALNQPLLLLKKTHRSHVVVIQSSTCRLIYLHLF